MNINLVLLLMVIRIVICQSYAFYNYNIKKIYHSFLDLTVEEIFEQYDCIKKVDENKALYFVKRAIEDKDDLIKRAIEDKERIIQSKDDLIKRAIEDKERIIQSKDDLIKAKDNLLIVKENELCRAKGLLTSRGIFERYLTQIMNDFKLLGILKTEYKLNVSNFIEVLNKEINNPIVLKESKSLAELMNQLKNCDCDIRFLREIYSTLSNEIHGLPWSGEGVKIYSSELSEKEKCIIMWIAQYFDLSIEQKL